MNNMILSHGEVLTFIRLIRVGFLHIGQNLSLERCVFIREVDNLYTMCILKQKVFAIEIH